METAFCTSCGTSLGAGAQFCPRCGTSISLSQGEAVKTIALAEPRDSRQTMVDALRRATIGEYEILGELGRGGMATVYLAHDLALDRKVAIKVLAPALLLMGEGMVERFKREARTAAALSHPHIIPIFAVKQSHKIMYFVMKHVQGRPLDAVIHELGRLPISMVQAIVAQVGDALAYAHRHGVVHRDIKSANIMIDEEGWAVVTDFGIAKVEEAQGLTLTGVTVGTPAYMSPEQCATCEVTGATDQYSLGVVAYEMLTGRLPFQSDSSMSVMYAHFNQQPRAVTELRADCPPNLASAVMRMLEKEPEERWPSMEDVVAVCGRPSLRHDDPVRSEMITLAKANNPARLLTEMNVPTSPIALAKSRRQPVATAPRRAGRWWWVLGAAAVAALVVWTAPWHLVRRAPSTALVDTVVAPRQATPLVAGPPRDSTAATRSRQPAGRRVAVRPPRRDSVPAGAAVRQEDSVLNSLRTTALTTMRRALDAGATAAELARGDTMVRGADSLTAQGRLSEAMVQLVTATSAWSEAERVARARVAREAAAPPPPPPVVAQPVIDPRVAIESVIATYARALETRDTSQVRRAYPGLTSGQQQGWQDLFRAARNLKASLTVTTIDAKGGTAEASVSGVYEFDNATTGRMERRPVTFRATLVAESGGWRLTAIH
ncbi:MAG TPA: serine/threonine-protein kinase [Gemmatimonadales bacterium]